MRKSQIISLVVLLVLVTAVIWIGSFTGGNSNPTNNSNTSSAETTAEPEATPEITTEEILELPNKVYTWSGSDGEIDRASYDQMKQYGAIFDGTEINKDAVFLTFETGYSGGDADNTMNAILDALKETGAKATFLISAEYIEDDSCAQVLRRIVNEGHALGNRGSVQIDMTNQSVDEYARILDTIRDRVHQLVGEENIKMKYFRPFGCKYSVRDLAIAKRCGMSTVFWTVNYAQENGLSGLKGSMTGTLKAGGIYNIPIYATEGNSNVLKDAIKAAQEKYTFAVLP